ncbi:uncharacterized protein LOC111086973 [Limulus polyphemus]|uniref:Uncharacterized protein LOC111086973 n=1 Tax=Limulus polyphemus TaxID=6850 RepID=A0ABM1SVL0_LIMPO|nr:uncharacterized protein LOC111086973 [Limulus polyphemus]
MCHLRYQNKYETNRSSFHVLKTPQDCLYWKSRLDEAPASMGGKENYWRKLSPEDLLRLEGASSITFHQNLHKSVSLGSVVRSDGTNRRQDFYAEFPSFSDTKQSCPSKISKSVYLAKWTEEKSPKRKSFPASKNSDDSWTTDIENDLLKSMAPQKHQVRIDEECEETTAYEALKLYLWSQTLTLL